MNLGSVFVAVLQRDWAMMKRYIVNTVSSLVSIYLIFLLIFLGFKSLSGYAATGALEGTMEGTVIGFFVWTFTIMAFSDLAWNLVAEAQAGTLEQLYLTPSGFKWVSGCTLISSLTLNFIPIVVLLVIMMATTGQWLNLDFISLVPLLLITVLGAYGFGFALGGLALIFKRIQAVFQIFQFVFIGFLVIPQRVPWAKFLPLSMGNSLIYDVMVDGIRLWELPIGSILTALVVGAVYLAVGVAVFSVCENIAKDRGLLGHY
ncbi:MAG: ABC transporter permease [Firmicutes bacterium]|jgi:ABC-2 type transport system permease protein|nr:ABC transporter permease [Bacillota bacterium]